MIHECMSENENVMSQFTGDQNKEKALRVPRAVNMVDGLPRACKLGANLAQEILGFLTRKMIIAQNLCVQLTPDQFSIED